MKIQRIMQEAVDPEAVKKWMLQQPGIKKYELHADGSVTINGSGINISYGDSRYPLPFDTIKALNGSATVLCYDKASSRLDKFIQHANYGQLLIRLVGDCPALSLAKIKGNATIVVHVTGKQPNGVTGRLMDVERTLMQGIQHVRDGILDIFDFQEQLIDAGLGKYAKL